MQILQMVILWTTVISKKCSNRLLPGCIQSGPWDNGLSVMGHVGQWWAWLPNLPLFRYSFTVTYALVTVTPLPFLVPLPLLCYRVTKHIIDDESMHRRRPFPPGDHNWAGTFHDLILHLMCDSWIMIWNGS